MASVAPVILPAHGSNSGRVLWAKLLSPIATGSVFALLFGAAIAAPQIVQAADPIVTTGALTGDTVQWWLSTGDATQRLAPQAKLSFADEPAMSTATINIDAAQQYQTMTGFGASFTDASSYNISTKLSAEVREELMQDLFSPAAGIGLSWIRQPIGASDYIATDIPASGPTPFYTYQDGGYNSPISIERDRRSIDLVKRALEINPELTHMGTPWSPPAWMRANNSVLGTTGGALTLANESAFADYLSEVSKQYQDAGIPFDFISLQNEPNYAAGYMGLKMGAEQQLRVIEHLSTKLPAKAPQTKVLGWDHNYQEGSPIDWNEASWSDPNSPNPAYPAQILEGVKGNSAMDTLVPGVAMHCYSGLPSWARGTTLLHNRFPTKDVYFTECSGTEGSSYTDTFGSTLDWHSKNYVFPVLRNYSKSLSFWNLALDQSNGPYPSGYGICSNCSATVTVNNDGSYTKNINYYLLGHFSKFVAPGAVRIGSDEPSPSTNTNNIAFKNPDGTFALVLYNSESSVRSTTVNAGGLSFTAPIPAKSMATFTWGEPDPTDPTDPTDPKDPGTTPPAAPQRTSTSLKATRSTQTYGTRSPATLTATVTGAKTSPSGTITFYVDSKVVAKVKTTGGTARVATAKYPLSWKLKPGTHRATATFTSSDTTAMASTSSGISVKITGAKTSTKAALVKAKIKRTSKAKVRVTVKVEKQSAAKVRAEGTLKIIRGKKVIKKVSLTVPRNGKITIKLPKLKRGKHSLRVTFTPASKTLKSSKAKLVKLTVK